MLTEPKQFTEPLVANLHATDALLASQGINLPQFLNLNNFIRNKDLVIKILGCFHIASSLLIIIG
jgi:hypothetical protein